MSVQQPTYEELVADVKNMKTQMGDYKSKLATFVGSTDEEDKKTEASFKQAMDDMKNKDKEHNAEKDDMEKVKDAFKKATEETDPEKKKDAMKKAMDEKDDYEQKHSKKGESEPAPKDEKKEVEAKVAHLENDKKIPLMQKILEATKIINPTQYDARLKELTAATLGEVESDYAKMQPFIAALGLTGKSVSPSEVPTMIPFQAGVALNDNPADIFSASVDDIDFSKVKTSDIMGMYN